MFKLWLCCDFQAFNNYQYALKAQCSVIFSTKHVWMQKQKMLKKNNPLRTTSRVVKKKGVLWNKPIRSSEENDIPEKDVGKILVRDNLIGFSKYDYQNQKKF